jgi:hypothetical protein
MDLRPLVTGDNAASAFAQRGARCLVRLSRDQLTARALGGLTVPDPLDGVACLPLHVIEAIYASMFGPGELVDRRPVALFSIAPAALARAEAAAAAAGLDFSPTSLDDLAARVRTLRTPTTPSILLGDDDFVANEPPASAPVVRHRYVLGTTEFTLDMADLVDAAGTFAPLGDFAGMCGPRHTAAARITMLRVSQRGLLASIASGQASAEMTDEHGSAVGGFICTTPLPPRLRSLSRAGASPVPEVGLRAAWHFGGAPGRLRVLQACIECALAACPILRLVVDGATVEEQSDHLALLSAGLGLSAPDSLPAVDALEAAVVALAAAVPASATVVARVRLLVDAHERRRAARAVAACDAPLDMSSSKGGSSGGGSGGGAAVLHRCHAVELSDVMSQPAMVALAGDVAAASSDVVVLGLALSNTKNVVPLQLVLSSASIATTDPTIRRIAAARPALANYFGQALHIDGTTQLPGGRSYSVSAEVVRCLQAGDLAQDWDRILVAPFRGSRFGQHVAPSDLTTVLRSAELLQRLRLVLGRLLSSLGYADGPTSLSAALDDTLRIISHSPPDVDSGAAAVSFFELVLGDASVALRSALRVGPGGPVPDFYAIDGPARHYKDEQLEAYSMVGALWRARCVSPALLTPPPPARTRTPAPVRSPGKTPAPPLFPPGLPTPAMLGAIGRDASDSLDDGRGTFKIKASTYSTAKAVGQHPALADRCLCVVGSWQSALGVRETLCPHWNGQTQTGDRSHAVIGTGPHAPVEGITGVKSGLNFARQ